MAFVYLHRRLDTYQPFYVGIGEKETRPFSKNGRNIYWKRIVDKVGYNVEILINNILLAEAQELEELLILEYGRKDNGTGVLANMTNGGEGNFGLIVSSETRKKMAKAKIGRTPNNKGSRLNPLTHGTMYCYNEGCRCELCKNECSKYYFARIEKRFIKCKSCGEYSKEKKCDNCGMINKVKKQGGQGNSILTEEDVIFIRTTNIDSNTLAKKYGISYSAIRRVRSGKTWKHIKPSKQLLNK